MINIVAAFADEARPFIDALSLRREGLPPAQRESSFALYARGPVRLVISGMGAANAEAATRFMLARTDGGAARWLNFGIAGSAQFPLGALVAARAVRNWSCSRSWKCRRAAHLPAALVHSVAQPETAYARPGVYDMEAAGICRALGARRCAAELWCIKLVTDGPARPVSRLERKTIRAMLARAAPQLARLPGALQQDNPKPLCEEP